MLVGKGAVMIRAFSPQPKLGLKQPQPLQLAGRKEYGDMVRDIRQSTDWDEVPVELISKCRKWAET